MKFIRLKKPKIWPLLPPFWTVLSSLAAFSWRYSVQEILAKWLSTSILLTEIITLKVVKWIIAWTNRFCWPCEGYQVSLRFFPFPPISSWTEWRHISTAWLPRQFQNGDPRIWDEFLQDSGHFRSWNWNYGVRKAECLLDIDKEKNNKCFGVAFFLWFSASLDHIWIKLNWCHVIYFFAKAIWDD